MKKPAKMRGPVVSFIQQWVKQTYGEKTLRDAINKLSPEEQAELQKLIPSLGWYPVATIERLLSFIFEDVHVRFGVTLEEFDRSGMQDGGGALVRSLYKFVLSMSSVENTLSRLPTLYSRVYDQGLFRLVKNEPGHCIWYHEAPIEMYRNSLRNLRYGLPHVFTLAGAKNVTFNMLREEKTEASFNMETEWRYEI